MKIKITISCLFCLLCNCIWRGRLIHFVERTQRRGTEPAMNVFRVDDFVGLNGENDKGLVSFTDRQLKELQWV
jgi:hypothetical protein